MLNAKELVQKVAATTTVDIIVEPQLGVEGESEFLVFFKPEIFMGDSAHQEARVDMMLAKLSEYKVNINGVIATSGPFIEQKQIMAAHYGFINQMSNNASRLVTAADRTKMTELLGEDCSSLPVYGGHEALKHFADFTPQSLDVFWFTRKSLKIKGGMYFQKYTHNGEDFLLVDGFHPAQLAYFTDSTHKTLLLTCSSKTSWKSLRWDLIGNTFPEKADAGSIRGLLFARAAEFGIPKVDIAANGIHLSAGPFEGMAEMNNFVAKSVGRDVLQETAMYKTLVAAGATESQIANALTSPSITTAAGVTKDLFGLTEDIEPKDAVELYLSSK